MTGTAAWWGLLPLLMAAAGSAPQAFAAGDVLPIGVRIECQLGEGGVRRHSIWLGAGEFVHLEVREKGPRLVFTLVDESGSTTARREAFDFESFTTRRLMIVAPAAGTYTLEVRSVEEGRAGTYDVRMEAPRPAADRERALAAADDALAEAATLSKEYGAEVRRRVLDRLEAAEAGFRAAGDRWGEAIVLLDRGNVQRGDWDSLRRSLSLFREVGDREGDAAALHDLSFEKRETGDLEGWRAMLETSAEMARSAGNQFLVANGMAGIAMTFDQSGQAEKAVEFYTHALAIATDIGNRELQGGFWQGRSISLSRLGEWEKAIEDGKHALSLSRAMGDRTGEILFLRNLGGLYRRVGDDTQALALLEEALSRAQGTGDPVLELTPLPALSSVLSRLGRHDQAIELARRGVDLSRQTHARLYEISPLIALGRSLHAVGENEEALPHLRAALHLEQEIRLPYEEVVTRTVIAEIERDRGDLRTAFAEAEAAVTLLERLRSEMTNPDLRASFVAAQQDTYGTCIDILMRLHEQDGAAGHDEAALRTSERARARVLLDALIEARADIRQGVPPALLERERALQADMSKASARLSRALGQKDAVEEAAAARQELEAKSDEYRLVQSRIRQESPRYAALTQPEPATVQQIRREVLDDETVLLEFYLAEPRSFLWALTRSTLDSHVLPGSGSIEAVARKVHALMTARHRTQTPAAAAEAHRQLGVQSAELSRLLLEGIAVRLKSDWKGKRLLVVPSGVLAYLPFGALPSPVENATGPLLDDHEIVFAPSGSVLLAQRREPSPVSAVRAQAAVLADPVFEAADPRVRAAKRTAIATPRPVGLSRALDSLECGRFGRLPFSRREADAIRALVPRPSLLEATDFAANRTLVTTGELANRRIVHFATHGLLDSQHPDLSGLVLSLVDENGAPQDGFLRMHETYNLRLSADLVVLSACQTALGRDIRGEGLIGLTRGFMYAGAPRVVASLWQVDDESTAELMKRFYREMLKEGRRPADALRRAQLELSRHPRWSAPFYWAGFVLQGEWK